MQAIKLRVDLLERKALKEQEECFEFAVAKAVKLVGTEDNIEVAVFASVEIEVELRKDAEGANARVRVEELRQRERCGRRKRECTVEQRGRDARLGVLEDIFDLRFAYVVPVLQRGFEIAFKEIGRAQEVVCVGVAGRKAKRLAHAADGLGIVFLLESDAGELDGESGIRRRKAAAGFECILRLGEAPKLRQSFAIVEIQLCRARSDRLQQEHDLVPVLVCGELL